MVRPLRPGGPGISSTLLDPGPGAPHNYAEKFYNYAFRGKEKIGVYSPIFLLIFLCCLSH